MEECRLCGKSKPWEWCWESSIECPYGVPPRGVDPRLWLEIQVLRKRVAQLEQQMFEKRPISVPSLHRE